MKALSMAFTVALIASFTTSAIAAPNKIMIPAPPPVAGAAPAGAPAVPGKQAATQAAAPKFVAVTPVFDHALRYQSQNRWVDDLTLKPNQDKGPLRLIIQNGYTAANPTAHSFSWFRVKANGEVIATEQSMKGKRTGIFDLSGIVPAGGTQIVIEAGGNPGAAMSWQVATMPMAITGIAPKQISPGEQVVLKGTNFPTDVQQINAVVGDSVADVLKATPTSITIKVSDVTKPGSQTLVISVPNLPPVEVPLAIAGGAAPVVSGIDQWAAPVGSQVKVRGKFFAPVANQNQVFFGPVAGQVVSSDKDSLTVVVPSIPGARGTVAVTVSANGKRSANSVAFNVGARATDPSYVQGVKQEVKVGIGVTTQNSSQAAQTSTSQSSQTSATQSALNSRGQSSMSESQSMSQSQSQSGGFNIVPAGEKDF